MQTRWDKQRYSNYLSSKANCGNEWVINARLPCDFNRYVGIRTRIDF
jgi:hypothetical protein